MGVEVEPAGLMVAEGPLLLGPGVKARGLGISAGSFCAARLGEGPVEEIPLLAEGFNVLHHSDLRLPVPQPGSATVDVSLRNSRRKPPDAPQSESSGCSRTG